MKNIKSALVFLIFFVLPCCNSFSAEPSLLVPYKEKNIFLVPSSCAIAVSVALADFKLWYEETKPFPEPFNQYMSKREDGVRCTLLENRIAIWLSGYTGVRKRTPTGGGVTVSYWVDYETFKITYRSFDKR